MLATGSILEGRYVVLREIRRGKTNVAYLGHVKNLPSKLVAIKEVTIEMAPDKVQETLDRFRREAQRCAAVDHPHLGKVEDFFVIDNTAYVIDDYVQGRSMQDILEARGQGLPLSVGLPIVYKLCDAIEYCHGLNPAVVMHAVQPPKIIIMPGNTIKIVDWGQSWADSPGSHTTDYLNGIGSHGYSPIERYVAEHTVDQVSDIYALGATIYAIFSGRTPPAAVEMITGQGQMERLDSINPELPKALADLVVKATATQRAQRFQSIAEVRAILDKMPHPIPSPKEAPLLGEDFVPVTAESLAAAGDLPAAGSAAPPRTPGPASVPGDRATPSSSTPGAASGPPASAGDELRVRRGSAVFSGAPRSAEVPHVPDELPIRRTAPPTPAAAPARPAAAVATPAAPADKTITKADLPVTLQAGTPPVVAVIEIEGKAKHLFGPKEVERVDIEVLSIGPDSLTFGCRRSFQKGSTLNLRMAVPLLAAGQSLTSEGRVTIRTQQEAHSGIWTYSGTLEVPPRLRPILANLHEQERRIARRFRGTFRVLSKMLKSYQASAIDISATGFGFISNTQFNIGEIQEFALDIDDAMQSAGGFKVLGRIVTCMPHEEGMYRIGVHFVNLDATTARPLFHYLGTFRP